ncbi:hypothetical protein QNM97_08525 [Gordonia sp. L191]|uniref:hypothetical protein n=1 Tax=Gordonia sp. L191 TaxID=2982699 RepID=UPI0024C04B3F|nr:hypothetical protein [Gordonia sp. L191]WHU49004.1 hypothetical protein QNM97_08525 [Gordonia sp. L191]
MGTSRSDHEPNPAPRDVNGRPVSRSRWQRLTARIGSRSVPEAIGVDDDDLEVIASCDDDAASSSTVLEGSSWRPQDQAVVRHHLVLPISRVSDAIAVAALDGYRPVLQEHDGPVPDGHEALVLARVQLVDALHLSQERSRMASLGSRHDGRAVGWQVLQRAGKTDHSGGRTSG